MTLAAAVQMASGPQVGANLLEAERLIAQASAKGAQLVVLPENFAFMGKVNREMLDHSEADGEGPIQEFLAQQARKHNVWLVGGTIPLEAADPDKVRAAALLFNDQGQRVARYDKIHLFDVHLAESGERYTESEILEPGDAPVVVETPFGRLGMAICYDLRFPELFRRMAKEGAEIMVLPSAFTAITGKAHWEPLLRARAIENLAYVIAPGQGGFHVSGRETHGHSMIVDPWGTVLDELPSGSGIVTARLDRQQLETVRRNFPALSHRRL